MRALLARFTASAALAFTFAGATPASGQAVVVTARTDATRIAIGESTTLRVFAQVTPDLRPVAAQIFAWHVDLVQEFADPVQFNVAALARSASDRNPATSSPGILDGNVLRSIYDTFIGRPAAGIATPAELFSLPLTGAREGVATFRIRAGSTSVGLSSDFLVSGAAEDLTWTGGDYSLASVSIEVQIRPPVAPSLAIAFIPSANGAPARVTLTFPPLPGSTHMVQWSDQLGANATWQDLPNGPHNSGNASDTVGAFPRFYRLRITTP